MLALDCGIEFDAAREQEFVAALPARPAVFLMEPRGELARPGASPQPYLARTVNLRRRLERLLLATEAQSKRLNLRAFTGRVRYRLTGSAFEQAFVFYQNARQLFPRRYRDLARLRPPALLKLNLSNPYPRCYVTRRILAAAGFYCGPFATRRAAEAFASEFLNLFKIRRCQIKIRRDPSFPGCIYSEMKMCLAPCFAGCTKEEYEVEVDRVRSFLASSGASLVSELGREREASSDVLDFERAAALHRRLEKVSEVLRGLPELVRRLDELDALVLQHAAEEQSVAVFVVRSGMIAEPFLLRFGELASQPRSAEEILREQLAAVVHRQSAIPVHPSPAPPADQPAQGMPEPATPLCRDTLADHLSLLARWFYSRPRQGDIFFPARGRVAAESAAPDWPYRRVIRACSRLLAAASQPFTGQQPLF